MNKVIKVMTLVLILVVCFSATALAIKPDDLSKGVNGSSLSASGNTDNLKGLGLTVIDVLKVVATIVAIAVLIFVGIKFLLASPAQKAGIKEMLIPYVIGAVLIFAAVPILTIIQNVAGGLEEKPEGQTVIEQHIIEV